MKRLTITQVSDGGFILTTDHEAVAVATDIYQLQEKLISFFADNTSPPPSTPPEEYPPDEDRPHRSRTFGPA